MKVWFSDPMELLDKKRMFDIWPVPEQSVTERINATSRFVILASLIMFLIKRDIRIFYLALMVLTTLWGLYKLKMVTGMHHKRPSDSVEVDKKLRFALDDETCQAPTSDNPMGNVLLADYTTNPQRPPACWSESVSDQIDTTLTDTFAAGNSRSKAPMPDVQRRHAARQFTSTAVSRIPGDQTAFAELLYGKKNAPMFKDGSSSIGDPNFRGVQLEAFAGMGNDGNIRR